MKIESLTPEQEAKLPEYTREGIEIGMRTENPTGPDQALLIKLANLHRVTCGLPEAKEVRFYPSPVAAIEAERAKGNDINTGNALYGQHDIGWLQFYKFFRKECGLVEETNSVAYLMDLAEHAGWFWMDEEVIIFSARPTEIHTKTREDGLKVLHNTDGMAIKYADGFGVYAVDGVRIT